MPFLERPGQPRLHYELDDYTDPWKKAPCIMLQHGYARSTKFWRAWIPYLSRFYRVLRLDLRWLEASNVGRRFPADADPALLEWTLDEMGKSDVDVLIAMFRFVSNVDAAPYLPRIAAPVLALYPAAAGVITKDEHTQLLRDKIR